jgi:hypothetical protein
MNNFFELINRQANLLPIIKPPVIIEPEIIEVETEILTENQYFNWEVIEKPIYNYRGQEIEGFKELVRSDNNFSLNVCANSYHPTTNQLFSNGIDFLSYNTGMQLKEVQELKGGKILLAYLQNPEPLYICGHEHKSLMILGNSHNYKSAFFIGEHTTMIRCENQFHRIKQHLKAYHTTDHDNQAKRMLNFYTNFKELQMNTINLMQKLESFKIDGKIKDKLIKHLLAIKPDENFEALSQRKQNIIEKLDNSINREVKALGYNAFALFNGVTHWTTHQRNTKEKIYSQFFGSTGQLNKKALLFCEELLK